MKYFEQASKWSRIWPCAFAALALAYAVLSLVVHRVPDACIAGVVFCVATLIAFQSFAVVCFDENKISYRQFFRKKTIFWEALSAWSPRTIRAGGGTAQMIELVGKDGTRFLLLHRKELTHTLQKYAKTAYCPASEKDVQRKSK